MSGIGKGFPFAKFDAAETTEQVRQMINQFPGLSRVPALLLVLLWDGRLKTYGYLRDEMDRYLGWTASTSSLTDAAKRCRPVIAPAGLEIETVPGVGYRLRRKPEEETPDGGLAHDHHSGAGADGPDGLGREGDEGAMPRGDEAAGTGERMDGHLLHRTERQDADEVTCPSWWILPAVLAGTAVWTAILSWVLT